MPNPKVEEVLALTETLLKSVMPEYERAVTKITALAGQIHDDKSISDTECAISFFAIKGAYETLDKLTKALYHSKDRFDKAIVPERLEAGGKDLIRVPELARSFSRQEKTSATFVDKEKGFLWLRSIGQQDLIQETVNAGTLSAFVRNLQMNEGVDPPEDAVKVTSYVTTGVNKYTPKNK